jgi:hypothetical protein
MTYPQNKIPLNSFITYLPTYYLLLPILLIRSKHTKIYLLFILAPRVKVSKKYKFEYLEGESQCKGLLG